MESTAFDTQANGSKESGTVSDGPNSAKKLPLKVADLSDLGPGERKYKSFKPFAIGIAGVVAVLGAFPSLPSDLSGLIGRAVPISFQNRTRLGLEHFGKGLHLSPSTYQENQYVQALKKIQTKLAELRRLDEENNQLKFENAQLRLSLEEGRYETKSKIAQKRTHEGTIRGIKETGSPGGRTVASTGYHPPMNLDQAQLYTLAEGYFKKGESEKAATILDDLLSEKGDPAYKTFRNFMMAGVAWFNAGNYKLANHYFSTVLKHSPQRNEFYKKSGYSSYAAQATLWKAVIASKLNQKTSSQFWMKEALDRYPHSQETGWVNLPGSKTKTLQEEHPETRLKHRKQENDAHN